MTQRPTTVRTFRVLVTMVLLGVVVSACGSGGSTGGGSTGRIEHPTGARDVVVRIATGGGFVPVQYHLTETPELSLYGDGRAITVGPTTEQYPPHALPNLQETRLSEDDVQRVLRGAAAAGLLDERVDYGSPAVSDAPATTIVVRADGATHTTTIYALGIDAGGLTDSQRAARRRVSRFVTASQNAASRNVSASYTAEALAVYVTPYRSPGPDTGVEPGTAAWPLGDLANAGDPSPIDSSYRCLVVRGADARAVLDTAAGASTITRWHSGSADYSLIFRPLLPDESTCESRRPVS